MLCLKKSLVFAAAVASLANAWAVDGTVTVTGTVAATTCTIVLTGGTVSGPSNNNLAITLPTIGVSALSTINATAGATPFSIGVQNCSLGGKTTFTPYFEGGNINAAGRISNNPSPTSVDVQITTGAGAVVNMAAASGSQGVSSTAMSTTPTVAVSNFVARYYANSASTTAGSFSGTFNYTLVYN